MEKVKKNIDLGETKISKLLVKFSIPCILSLLVSSLYNIVDQIFIGNSEIGYLGNAATTVVFPITVIALAFAWCFGDGSAAYLSICQGKNQANNAHKCIGNSLIMTFIASIILLVIGFVCMEPILYLFGASDASIGLAKDYFTIILAAFPIYMLSNMMNSVIRADGSPAISMTSMLVGAITNIILDPIFIFALNWGIAGAAWATIIGQFLSFVISFVYFFKTKTFKLSIKSFAVDFKILWKAVKLGISTFITQIAIVAISLVANIMLVKYGASSEYGIDIPIAVIGIVMKVFTIVINIVVGIILGAQPILGYNYGAGKYDRVREVFKITLILCVIIGLVATLLFELCPGVIIGIFGSESELYNKFAELTFRVFLAFVLFTCLIKMSSIFFQAVGNPIKSAIVSLVRDILFFIPLACTLPIGLGIEGVLWAAPIADALGMIITVVFILLFFKDLKKKELSAKENTTTNDVKILKSKEGLIITISRQHGSAGKEIGRIVAQKLNIPYYYKETTALVAKNSGLSEEYIKELNEKSESAFYDLYLSHDVAQLAINAQEKVIKDIAEQGSCVIVGRAADYFLRDKENVVNVFIYAPVEYRVKKIQEMYGDDKQTALQNMKKSDKSRANYYKSVTGKDFGEPSNYDLCIDSSIGVEKTADLIIDFVNKMNKKNVANTEEVQAQKI